MCSEAGAKGDLRKFSAQRDAVRDVRRRGISPDRAEDERQDDARTRILSSGCTCQNVYTRTNNSSDANAGEVDRCQCSL